MMPSPWLTRAGLVLLTVVAAGTEATAQLGERGSADRSSPMITHVLQEGKIVPGFPVEVAAQVTDNVSVTRVQLFYRQRGGKAYRTLEMRPGSNGLYTALVPASDVRPGGLEYFLVARDAAGNVTLRGFSTTPLGIEVTVPVASALPTVGQAPWYARGWTVGFAGAVLIGVLVLLTL